MIIAVTGTPGTGKTHLVQAVQRQFPHHVRVLEANKLLVERKLTSGYDRKAKTYDIDPKILKRQILSEIIQFKKKMKKNNSAEKHSFENRFDELLANLQRKNSLFYSKFRTTVEKDSELRRMSRDKHAQECILLIDSHLSHLLPKKAVDWCIIMKTSLKTLQSRLNARKYPLRKIQDNLQAEAFESSQMEAQDLGHRLLCIHT